LGAAGQPEHESAGAATLARRPSLPATPVFAAFWIATGAMLKIGPAMVFNLAAPAILEDR
jgi:hypothetical protein